MEQESEVKWKAGTPISPIYHCEQCGREMNIIEYLIGSVCLDCCRKNQKEVAGIRRRS